MIKFKDKNALSIPQFKTPVIAKHPLDISFVADPYQGHTMPKGKEFLGRKEYISIEELVIELQKSKKKIILNIGDSSTSGWDSNIITQNRERFARGLPLLPTFFQYETYSDYLRDLIGKGLVVINAGVPGHTSLQGYRRLKVLLDYFKKEKLVVQWVTAYYGNNDSVWDYNRQDKEWVGRKVLFSIKNFFKFSKHNKSSMVIRVTPEDYKAYMKKIIQLCNTYEAKCILIEPITPIYWKPGTRVQNEDLDRKNDVGSKEVYQLLDEARRLWSQAIKENTYSKLKEIVLEEAREKDYVMPRIKKTHLLSLRSLAKEMETAYVYIDLNRAENDIRYFIDYCHPIRDANKLIAHKIAEIISGKESLFKEKHQNTTSSKGTLLTTELPVSHYTLY